MSRQLAISSAVSVMLMSAFVLFGPHAARDPLGIAAYASAPGTIVPAANAPAQPASR